MKKVSLSLVVALNMLTSLYAENNATASTPEDLGTIEVQDTQKLRRDDRDYEARKLVKSTTRLDLTARETPQSLTVVTEAKLKDMGITDYQVLMRNIAGITSGRMDERLYPTARGFSIDYYLETIAKKQEKLPVLNTILFYTQSNAAIDLKLAIDDVLPSFISRISNLMSRFNIKAFYEKNSGTDETIYLQNLFESRLGVMSFLLSRNKFDLEIMIERYSDLIYHGSVNKSYAKKLEWSKYFNDFYKERKFENIAKYQNFFNETNVLNKKLVFQKECDLENLTDKKELIKELIKNSEFLNQNDALISAYLLGMLSAALINWQLGVNGGVSFSNWLNDCGSISMENLERIWTKCDEMIRKLKAASGKPNANIENIKECLIEILPQVFSNEKKIVKTSHTTLAFAMGGSDYRKFIKEKTK